MGLVSFARKLASVGLNVNETPLFSSRNQNWNFFTHLCTASLYEFREPLHSSVLLRGVMWFKTDVSGQPMGSIFKGQLDLTPRNNPEDGSKQFHRGGSLRLREPLFTSALKLTCGRT